MQFDPHDLTVTQTYKLMTGTIIPRPIGWISTVAPSGQPNLAPFSYFNGMSADPPHVVFGAGMHGPDDQKDTIRNIEATGEFVANLVHEEIVEQMNLTATILDADVDEFAFAGVTAVPSQKITPPRVKESLVNFECKVVHTYTIQGRKSSDSTIVIGEVVMIHVDDSILEDNYRINLDTYHPVGRLMGSRYAKVSDIFSLDRLPRQRK